MELVDENEGYDDEDDEVVDIFQGEAIPEFTFVKLV